MTNVENLSKNSENKYKEMNFQKSGCTRIFEKIPTSYLVG